MAFAGAMQQAQWGKTHLPGPRSNAMGPHNTLAEPRGSLVRNMNAPGHAAAERNRRTGSENHDL